jgi:uncharacterized membrane protein
MGACDVESLPCNSLIVWTKESRICSFVYQSTIVFAFTNSHFMNTCCSGIQLRVVTTTITFTGTLLGLEVFTIIVVVVVGLVQNMF